MKYWISLSFLALLGIIACNKPDLALINSVKSFEARWQDLHENLNFIDRNLTIANQKYPSHLQELASFISKNPNDTATATKGFELEYKRMMLQKDKIELSYKKLKTQFEQQVKDFNDWNRRFMRNKISNDKAKTEFAGYKNRYDNMSKEVDSLKQNLILNINRHNDLARDKAFSIGNYNNFQLDPH